MPHLLMWVPCYLAFIMLAVSVAWFLLPGDE